MNQPFLSRLLVASVRSLGSSDLSSSSSSSSSTLIFNHLNKLLGIHEGEVRKRKERKISTHTHTHSVRLQEVRHSSIKNEKSHLLDGCLFSRLHRPPCPSLLVGLFPWAALPIFALPALPFPSSLPKTKFTRQIFACLPTTYSLRSTKKKNNPTCLDLQLSCPLFLLSSLRWVSVCVCVCVFVFVHYFLLSSSPWFIQENPTPYLVQRDESRVGESGRSGKVLQRRDTNEREIDKVGETFNLFGCSL